MPVFVLLLKEIKAEMETQKAEIARLKKILSDIKKDLTARFFCRFNRYKKRSP